MARIIIHGGTGKTGTTSIQTALAQNRDVLASMGIRSFRSNRSNTGRSVKHRLAWRDPTDASWTMLREELEQLKETDDTVIMSNESLFSLKEDAVEHLASQFKGFEVAVLVYVREQTDYLQTLLLQHQKRQERHIDLTDRAQVQNWLERRMRNLDYFEMGERFDAAFGPGTFHARIFDRSMMIDQDLLVDFFTTVGVTDFSEMEMGTHTNSSLNPKYATVIREHQEQLTQKHRYTDVLDLAILLSKDDESPRWFLSEQEVNDIKERFAESNRRFFAQFVLNGGSFSDKRTYINRADLRWDTQLVADEMEKLMNTWPQLSVKGWNGKAGSAKKFFSDGWVVTRGDGVRVLKVNDAATVRFRLPDRKLGQWPSQRVILDFETEGPAVPHEVAINGEPQGTVMFGEEPIELPFSLLGPIHEAEITLTGPIDGESIQLTAMNVAVDASSE